MKTHQKAESIAKMGGVDNSPLPLTKNSEVCTVLTCLPEKAVVDFANGIDVVRDHIRVQEKRSGIKARLFDGFNGSAHSRQASINASLADGLEASLLWLENLSGEVAKTNYAVAQVTQRVAKIQGLVIKNANYSRKTREMVHALNTRFSAKCEEIDAKLNQLNIKQKSNDHIDLVFGRWGAGKLNDLPIAARCYAAIEELCWGDFGDCVRFCADHDKRRYVELIEHVTNKATIRMNQDAGIKALARLQFEEWITPQFNADEASIPEIGEAVLYLADWSTDTSAPFVNSIVVASSHTSNYVPFIFDANRLAKSMVNEVFQNRVIL